MNSVVFWALLVLGVLNLVLLLALVLRREETKSAQAAEQLSRELRQEISESARHSRQELTQNLATFQQTLV